MNSLKFLLIVFVSLKSFAVSSEYFDFKGYLRTGVGTNSLGGDQSCFNNPGSSGNEFRLGNECETYGELRLLAHHMKAKSSTDPFFKAQINLGFLTNGDTNWEYVNSEKGMQLREAFIEAGNIDQTGMTYWVGNRFYRDNDVYMNDFHYFGEMSSNGAGVGNIKLGSQKLFLAYLKQTSEMNTNNGNVSLTFLDLRLKDIKVTEHSDLKLWFGFGKTSSGTGITDGKEYGGQNGQVMGALLSHSLNNGFNHFSVTYGDGVMENIHIYFAPIEKESEDHRQEERSYRLRMVEHLTYKLTDSFEMHSSLTYELRDNGEITNNKEVWYNIGFHPIYYFSKHKQVAAVVGYSSVDKQGESDRRLFRMTIAPQISINKGIWARPILRAFYTHSFWSRSNRGNVGGDAYKDKTSGANFGFQAEVFF